MVLSIIILNYRQRNLVRQCLRGILAAQANVDYEVLVVDNASGDGCLEMVGEFFPWVRRVASPRNRGFSAGMNLGLAQAHGEFVMLLNPDIALFAGQVDALVEFLRGNPRVGILGPRLVHPDGSRQASCRRFPRLFTPLYRRTMLGRLPMGRQRLDWFLMRDADLGAARPVDWLIGACWVVRRQVFQSIGALDEGFFLYFEDLDFCRRAWQAGWEVWYLPNIAACHYYHRESAEHGGLSALLYRAGRHHFRSALRYYRKYGRNPLPAASPTGQSAKPGVE